MLEEHVLDAARVDVLAARDDHVLHAVLDEDVAFVVHDAGVAGVHPAAAQRFRRFVRQVPVAAHQLRPARDDLADRAVRHGLVIVIDDAHFRPDDRPAGREQQLRLLRDRALWSAGKR